MRVVVVVVMVVVVAELSKTEDEERADEEYEEAVNLVSACLASTLACNRQRGPDGNFSLSVL